MHKYIDFDARNEQYAKEMKSKCHSVSLKNISKGFYSSGNFFYVLKDLSYVINPGDAIALIGASGIGKSTFLTILGTLDRPDSGEYFFKDQSVFNFDDDKLAKFRNEAIGFVFQFHHLLSEFTVLENVAMPLFIRGIENKESLNEAEAMLIRVGLKERLSHKVTEISGGEQQRVALARALVLKPALLLADEPTGNLDKKNSDSIHNLFLELNKEYNMTMLIVTHNMELAGLMKKKLTLIEGKLVEVV